MDLVKQLQGLKTQPTLARVPLKEFTRPEGYRVEALRPISTRFGRAIVVEFYSETSELVSAFLPKRFAGKLDDDACTRITEDRGFTFKCTGMVNGSPEIEFFRV